MLCNHVKSWGQKYVLENDEHVHWIVRLRTLCSCILVSNYEEIGASGYRAAQSWRHFALKHGAVVPLEKTSSEVLSFTHLIWQKFHSDQVGGEFCFLFRSYNCVCHTHVSPGPVAGFCERDEATGSLRGGENALRSQRPESFVFDGSCGQIVVKLECQSRLRIRTCDVVVSALLAACCCCCCFDGSCAWSVRNLCVHLLFKSEECQVKRCGKMIKLPYPTRN